MSYNEPDPFTDMLAIAGMTVFAIIIVSIVAAILGYFETWFFFVVSVVYGLVGVGLVLVYFNHKK